ncbi:MAG: hypothetical protein EX269_15975, partial [Acidimicrobiales bacterium]
MHRISRLKVVVVLATVGVLFGVVAPASALSNNPTLEEELQAIRRANRVASLVQADSIPAVDPPRVDSPHSDVRPDIRPIDVRPEILPAPRPIQLLKLECGHLADVDGKAAGCKWSESNQAHAYQLWVIVNRQARELVGTYNASTLSAKDRLPEDTHVARYAVVALDKSRTIVGRSRLVSVTFKNEPPAIDELKIECEKIDTDARKAARCDWSGSDQARGYQLWRLVNRGHRELVGTFNNETFSARNALPDDTFVVRYAVLAIGTKGQIVGRSRVATLTFPTIRPIDPPLPRPIDPPVKPIDPPIEPP